MAEDARSAILGGLRKALDTGAGRAEAVDRRLAERPRGTVPSRGLVPAWRRADLFAEMAQGVGATVERVGAASRVPHAIADYLAAHNLPARLRLAPDPELLSLPWDRRPTLEVTAGRAEPDDIVSVTPALAGIAETGTLLAASGPGHPTTLNFLPAIHIVVLHADRVVGTYEEAWERLREAGAMPRTANLITGPSRTGDIEQTIFLHAHGPGRLHIVLVDGTAHG
ncbi:MAG TPA: lactate utilization protein [Azospirillaceae bacterium]|nr:lactate utilization protein [Azospirillaceae bacterium]